MRKALLYAVLLLVLLWMAYGMFVSKTTGYRAYRIAMADLNIMQQENAALMQQREALSKRIRDVRKNPQMMESLVHQELGYVYPDEIMLIVPETQEGKK